MTFLLLFWEFFKTGLFAIGGGMATLPFLSNIAEKYPWFTTSQLSDMIAVSESTPGPIGVNMATYAGYNTGFGELGFWGGILGAVTATVGLVAPSVVIIIIVANFLKKFQDSRLVKDAFYTLRPVVTALIAAAGFSIIKITLVNPEAIAAGGNISEMFNLLPIIMFVVILIIVCLKPKIHPIFFILASAVLGIVFKL